MLKLIESWSAKRRAVAELSRLSNRALADLGIARTEIVSVVTVAAGAQEPDDREMNYPLAGHRHVPAWA